MIVPGLEGEDELRLVERLVRGQGGESASPTEQDRKDCSHGAIIVGMEGSGGDESSVDYKRSMTGDRRIGSRFPAHEEVEVAVRETPSEIRTGTLRDLSRSGARIRLDHSIPVNAAIGVKIRDQQLKATVLSCKGLEGGYELGVEFDREFEGPLRPAE